MMDDKTLLERLKTIHGCLMGEEYPQTMMVIEMSVSKNFTEVFDSAYWFAKSFAETDATRLMHPAVADFVKEVCEEEIADGSAEAPCLLGSLYYSGRIGEQDYAKAFELYTLASDRGSDAATENLGYCYYYGLSVPVDYEKAFLCFAQGAFDGQLVISLFRIGDMYRKGNYVAKNENEAFRIYCRCQDMLDNSVENNCEGDVYLRLGDCYFEGIGTEKNLMKALKNYQKAIPYLIDRVSSGDYFLRHNYEHCVEREKQARELLEKDFPD